MAFYDSELSNDNGEIAELYEFSTSDSKWRYTTYNKPILAPDTYAPLLISRQKMEQSKNLLKLEMSVKLPRDVDIAIKALDGKFEEVILLDIWQVQVGEPTDKQLIFKGRYIHHDMEENEMSIFFEPISTTMQRLGFRAKYQRLCRHTLYGGMCGANTANHTATGKVTSILRNKITLDEIDSNIVGGVEQGYPQSYFTTGYIVTADGSRRMITNHSNVILTLLRAVPSLNVGDTISVYAGCDRTFATCRDKFRNQPNYGGFDYIPRKNPFSSGSQIF